MQTYPRLRAALGCAFLFLALGQTATAETQPDVRLSAGAATYTGQDLSRPFSQMTPNRAPYSRMDFLLGEAIFSKLWVSSPSSTTASDGLGPLYNARACRQCHLNDGRGAPPEPDARHAGSAILRLSRPARSASEHDRLVSAGVIGDDRYGKQLQDFAVPGQQAEGYAAVSYTLHHETLADGTQVELRKPSVKLKNLALGAPDSELMTSLRIAPPMIGLGLLELIPQRRLEQLADPLDSNNDGISGRINLVWDRQTQQTNVGRFGWKAGQPTLAQQNASALHDDIGIGNPLYPSSWGDCTLRQLACRNPPPGHTEQQDGLEASAEMMRVLLDYTRHLAVPAARNTASAQFQRGQQLFSAAGCASCHTPSHQTAKTPELPALSEQTIYPYSDLLLHDMGAGLSDQRPEFLASGSEWRTPPLWGLGLNGQANAHSYYLHDGRARTLLEAILWHGGEAAPAREAVKQLNTADRQALIHFLESI